MIFWRKISRKNRIHIFEILCGIIFISSWILFFWLAMRMKTGNDFMFLLWIVSPPLVFVDAMVVLVFLSLEKPQETGHSS